MSDTVRNAPQLEQEDFLSELEASIIRKLDSKSQQAEAVVYEFTDDRALLHQYYRLREMMYRKVFKTDQFIGEEDVHDKLSHILIARRGRLCIGGCRLTVREGDEDFMLPMESADFKLRNVFANLPLKKVRHGEVSRFAIMDDDKDSLEVMRVLGVLLAEKCVDAGLDALFLKSSLPMARNWRKLIQTQCGQHNIRICSEIQVPENPIHPEIKWYITEALSPAIVANDPELAQKDLVRPDNALVH